MIMPSRSCLRFAIALSAALLILTQSALQLAQRPAPAPTQAANQPDAQTPTREQDTTVRITPQLVQVDATVTDKKGEHVEDLTEDDFELTVDGKKQAVTYFRLVKLPEPRRAEGDAAN